MPAVIYQSKTIELLENETVLDGLLRHQIDAAYSCRSGACQACMMRTTKGNPPANSQHGLKDTFIEQGYFLACQCVPTEDLEIGEAHSEVTATVTGKDLLNKSVMRLRLAPQDPFEFRAGQYLQLVREDNVIRSYSIASLPGEDIELHVERVPQGEMSGWIFTTLQEGDAVKIRGPVGECFYVKAKTDQPLLLAGTATGLAPLFGILRDALQHQHTGDIHILHGSTVADRLYYVNELIELSQRHENVHYQACALHGENSDEIHIGDLQELAMNVADSFAGWRAYLCGNPDLVFSMRKKIFIKGASNKEIFADAFLQTKPAAAT